ncbi:MAG TPA: hypothetical protein VD997_06770 [Phycisphaerales bacterium]|nr:hypothetical protein [Phycisphaerales bacterium]
MFTYARTTRGLIALSAPALLAFAGCKEKAENTASAPRAVGNQPVQVERAPNTENRRDIHRDLRERALTFRVPAGTPRVTPHQVHGIVVDWGMDIGTTTVVFMNDGSASVYVSGGGGVIGAGDQPGVRDAGIKVLDEAAQVLPLMSPSPLIPLPGVEEMRFTVITDQGLFTASDSVAQLSSGTGPFAELGNRVQELIFAISQAERRANGR